MLVGSGFAVFPFRFGVLGSGLISSNDTSPPPERFKIARLQARVCANALISWGMWVNLRSPLLALASASANLPDGAIALYVKW